MPKKTTCGQLEEKSEQPKSETEAAGKRDRSVIRALSEDFQRFADRSQDAIYRFDIESQTFPFFNRRFVEHYAIHRGGVKLLSNRSVIAHIHPDDRDKVRAARDASFADGVAGGEIEFRYAGADDTVRWMEDRWTVIRDCRGRPIAVEGFIRDITRSRQAEDELERSRHNALIGSYIVRNGIFDYVNPEFCRIIGYEEKELLGSRALEVVHEEDRQLVREKALEMIRGAASAPYVFRIVHKKGEVRWIMETVTSILFEGRRASLGYFMDITSRKLAEKERLEREKLQTIVELASSVGHELNNPLQIVLSCSERLKVDPSAGPAMEEMLSLLRVGVSRLSEIVAKFQNVTQYATTEYVQGKRMIDIHKASGGQP